MDIERINGVLNRAIVGIQDEEIAFMSEAMAGAYQVPSPKDFTPDRRWNIMVAQAKEVIATHFKKTGKKINKTNLRKIRRASYDFIKGLGLLHTGAYQVAIDEMIDGLTSLKDYKRELVKLKKQQGSAHSMAMGDALSAPGRAMGRKASRDRGMATRHDQIRRLERKIAELGG